MSLASALAAIDPRALEWGGALLFGGGLFAGTWLGLQSRDALPYRLWARYVSFLESKLRLLFSARSGRVIALGQLAALVALAALNVAAGSWWTVAAAAVALAAPALVVERMLRKRRLAIEAQLDGFTMALASALKSTPSLASAFQSMVDLTAQPMQGEIAYAVKAMRLGASLDQALLLMASRIGSADFDMVASSMLIGRLVGGDLPTILESTAASLREMARLEQAVRTKTAEGKAQLWVLAVFPLFLVFGLASLMPNYFDVLTGSLAGYVLAILSAVLWGSSIVVARKIVNVAI